VSAPGFLTPAEVADLAGVSPDTITRLCRIGRIEGAEQLGRVWVIPVASAEQFLKGYQPYDTLRRSPDAQA
jgi:excisionase family DNA binding protein